MWSKIEKFLLWSFWILIGFALGWELYQFILVPLYTYVLVPVWNWFWATGSAWILAIQMGNPTAIFVAVVIGIILVVFAILRFSRRPNIFIRN